MNRDRTAKDLSEMLSRHLSMYTLAASAAGVGILASAPSGEAKIVYTPANVPIPFNGGLVQFDLNRDGINDFGLSAFSYQTHGLGDLFLKVVPDQSSNEIVDQKSNGHVCAAALPKGTKVGPKSRFQQDPAKGLYMWFVGLSGTQGSGTRFGPWFGLNGRRFLGLKFSVNGKTHYGWARIKQMGGQATLTGFAYETVPNTSIVTGTTTGADKQGSLGVLASGATRR